MSKQNAGKRGTRMLYVQLFLLCLRVTSVLGSMNDAPWACSVHCADSGRCGDGGFYNYLLPEPCSTKVDSELSHSAGCDFRVCKEVCSSLQASKQNVVIEGNIYNWYKSSERSFASLEVASDATVAFGCGFSGHAHGGTFLFGKDDGNGGNSCYEPGVSRPRWNTASGVREEDFCYGGCQNSTGFGIYQDTEEYICATLHGHEICKQNKTLTYEIAKLRHRVWLLESNIDKYFDRSGETMTPIQISDGKEYIERRELTKMFIPAILVSLASFIAFTTSLYQIFRANQRVRYIYSNFTGD